MPVKTKVFEPNLEKVIRFATTAHQGQLRKTGVPYIAHPIGVMNTLTLCGVRDKTVLAAALCHDILEDCPYVKVENLIQHLGPDAYRWVRELTFSPSSGSKEDYLKSFSEASIEALVVKVADRVCNTEDFLSFDKEKGISYWEKASDLLDFFKRRKTEVVDTFSKEVFKNLTDLVKVVQKKTKEQHS